MDFSGRSLETKHVASFADRIKTIAIRGRRRERAAFIEARIERALVSVFPNNRARVCVETKDCVFVAKISHREQAAVRDGHR
jgi:hypothetical protein